MEENKVQVEQEQVGSPVEQGKTLPAEVSVWTKIKNFLCQEIKVEMTPKQAKVLQEVHDFWHQEITGKDVHDFLFQEITAKQIKDFWLQKIDITL